MADNHLTHSPPPTLDKQGAGRENPLAEVVTEAILIELAHAESRADALAHDGWDHKAAAARIRAAALAAAPDPLRDKGYRCRPDDPCGGCDLCLDPYYDCRCQRDWHPWCPVHLREWSPDGSPHLEATDGAA